MVRQMMQQLRWATFGLGMALLGVASCTGTVIAQAQDQVELAQVLDLVKMYSERRTIGVFGDRYRLSLRLPPTVPGTIQRIEIQQATGVQPIRFLLPRTQAQFNQGRRETVLPLEPVRQDQQTGVIAIPFAAPLTWTGAAEDDLRITLYPRRNPTVGGTYLFKVTAVTDQTTLVLGFGRLQFYTPSPH